MKYQFWIDVGGTFTDCLAVMPDGSEAFTKVLSSGITKGNIETVIADDRFVDPARIDDGESFWRGARIKIYSENGKTIGAATISGFDSTTGEFAVDGEIGTAIKSQQATYEIFCDLPAPILAIHRLQKVPVDQPLKPCSIDLGTTRGTNALLTRTGARTGLVTSHGMRDFLTIGDQARPQLFELTIAKSEPIFDTSIELDERVLADGTVERAPDPDVVREQLLQLKKSGIESIAVSLMFGFKYPKHEQQVGLIASELGFASVVLSSEVAPLIKIVPRAETTVLDAYLNPVIASYLNEVRSRLSPNSEIRFMTSAGGLVPPEQFSGKDSVLSGPAGGVVGAARVAQSAGFKNVIGFDMGGTSTDVSRFDGKFERTFETRKAGVRIVTPMLAVETVAAGGGSICWFDGTKLRVGSQSAGADPGPACYGRGGPLTVTDINLFLGRICRELFPFELRPDAVHQRLAEIRREMKTAGFELSHKEIASGFLKIANHNMSAAIRTVSVAKGYDPQEYVLMSFGGAGSQHACAVAENLQMKKILDHPNSSILSAVGIRLADQTSHAVQAVGKLLDAVTTSELKATFSSLKTIDASEQHHVGSLDLRYQGTEAFINIASQVAIEAAADFDFRSAFLQKHQQLFGYLQDRPIEVVAARLDSTVEGNRLEPLEAPTKFQSETTLRKQELQFRGQTVEASLLNRNELVAGDLLVGPAIIADRFSTTIVDPSWEAKVLPSSVLILERVSKSSSVANSASKTTDEAKDQTLVDPIQLEIFNSHFANIAQQMGTVLQQTSVSVNVKERLDFSCAIFTNTGDLVVNAPHIPVHLGAMSETVRSIIELNREVKPGDVFVTNDPYAGGSHLPDVTVVTPVFGRQDEIMRLWFWVASRSHHAEIGGMAPGSMPAAATKLGEEGVLIQNFKLIDAGVQQFESLRQILTGGRFPSRSPNENIADVQAQVAANQTGVRRLLELADRYSIETTIAYMNHIQAAAEQKSRNALTKIADGEFEFSDSMDNGATIRVRLQKHDDELTIDFTGTDPATADNLNANHAIVCAATMYVMRLLIDEAIPLNEGVMKPVTIRLPECFLNPVPASDPLESPAIVGGNVETSQRVVDVLLGALGLAAASQGTMNNWLMGGSDFGYYETIGGGSGATSAGSGADVVHSHMTNTRLTDPEVLETRYPVILREFAIRKGSGGVGRHRGGDGMIRTVEFTQPLTVSLLTSRRTTRPYGLEGGESGSTGENVLKKANETTPTTLPYRCEIQVQPGDRLRIETPGGGGFGERL